MLQSIAASIKDLSHEMKSAIAAFRETLHLSMTSTDSSIARLLTQRTLPISLSNLISVLAWLAAWRND